MYQKSQFKLYLEKIQYLYFGNYKKGNIYLFNDPARIIKRYYY